jgi:sulfur-carrier protein
MLAREPDRGGRRQVAKVVLASALSRWLPLEAGHGGGEASLEVGGATVAQALDGAFALHPNLRGYVLDEHGAVRHHVAVFVDGAALRDKRDLSQPLQPGSEVYVIQALSGG